MTAATPGTLFVNLYGSGVAGAVGTAFPSKEKADQAATSQRICCLELFARNTDGLEIAPSDVFRLRGAAAVRGVKPAALLYEALEVALAILPEVRAAGLQYAAKEKIGFSTAVAEACRVYFVEARE